MGRVLAVVREVCTEHGLEFTWRRTAEFTDDVWANVTAHMWGCSVWHRGFEDRVDRGLNYNLVIEVGADDYDR